MLETELTPVLEEAQAGQRHVFFLDAAHFVLGALHAITHEILTVTTDTYIKSQSVVELFTQVAARFTDLPITVVLDNARYQRNHFVMAEAERLGITLLGLPTIPRISISLNGSGSL